MVQQSQVNVCNQYINRFKYINHEFITIDAEQTFDKNLATVNKKIFKETYI